MHRRIFDWYFEGPEPVRWKGLRVLDAGCGMGRWLHFALERGAEVVGMDVSPAIDVAAAREGERADFVQADLRWPPFPPGSFDLVYSLGVLHHLEEPLAGVGRWRSWCGRAESCGSTSIAPSTTSPWWKRGLFARGHRPPVGSPRACRTRRSTAVAWLVAAVATVLFLWPRRLLRRWRWGDRLTRHLPLVHYTDVPFRMVVAEQFDRLVAPIEGRFRREDVEGWLRERGVRGRGDPARSRLAGDRKAAGGLDLSAPRRGAGRRRAPALRAGDRGPAPSVARAEASSRDAGRRSQASWTQACARAGRCRKKTVTSLSRADRRRVLRRGRWRGPGSRSPRTALSTASRGRRRGRWPGGTGTAARTAFRLLASWVRPPAGQPRRRPPRKTTP